MSMKINPPVTAETVHYGGLSYGQRKRPVRAHMRTLKSGKRIVVKSTITKK